MASSVPHFQLPFAVWRFLWGKQRWIQSDCSISVCSLKKRHLNVPLQLDSDEFVSRAIIELCHFSKEQNRTEIVSNVWQNPKRKRKSNKSNKFAEMAEWWKYFINLPFYFPYVAAAVSLGTTEKEMIRWAWKTKRCKRNWVLFSSQKNDDANEQQSNKQRD